MALATVKLDVPEASPLPAGVSKFLADAAARIDAFVERHRDDPAAGFVPADYERTYRTLRALREDAAGRALIPGRAFCEWGSGLGVIACLASMVGFDAVGIEIDARLVEASKSLAADHRVRVELIAGSYVPEGHHVEEDFDESHVMTLQDGVAAYDELGLEINDFDCIFAYPWPGEDDVVTAIFDRHAARGSLLMTFHGQDGMLLRRKVR